MLFKIMLDKKRAEEREKDAALCESIFWGVSRAHTHTHGGRRVRSALYKLHLYLKGH